MASSFNFFSDCENLIDGRTACRTGQFFSEARSRADVFLVLV